MKSSTTIMRQHGRNTNLELFRIITMLFIVAHHYVVNSGLMDVLQQEPFAFRSLFFYLFGAWGKTGINCFVMITGYFMCKSQITVKKFLKLLLQIQLYRIIIYIIFAIFGYEALSIKGLVLTLIPVKTVSDGFTSAFIVFYLFIPFLNILLKNLNEKMHIRLIFLSLFLYTFLGTVPVYFRVTMNYVSWFIVIYFISSYIRLYPKQIFDNTAFWGIASLLSIIISSLSIFLFLKLGMPPFYLISDSNKILAVITAFCLFMFFKNIKIPYSKTVNTIASASFGVLLIHANSDAMRQWLWKDVLKNAVVFNTPNRYLHFVCSVLGIYIFCTIIDLLRQVLLEKPFFNLYDKIYPKLNFRYKSLEYKISNKLKSVIN